jgi:hypothetical protein
VLAYRLYGVALLVIWGSHRVWISARTESPWAAMTRAEMLTPSGRPGLSRRMLDMAGGAAITRETLMGRPLEVRACATVVASGSSQLPEDSSKIHRGYAAAGGANSSREGGGSARVSMSSLARWIGSICGWCGGIYSREITFNGAFPVKRFRKSRFFCVTW